MKILSGEIELLPMTNNTEVTGFITAIKESLTELRSR